MAIPDEYKAATFPPATTSTGPQHWRYPDGPQGGSIWDQSRGQGGHSGSRPVAGRGRGAALEPGRGPGQGAPPAWRGAGVLPEPDRRPGALGVRPARESRRPAGDDPAGRGARGDGGFLPRGGQGDHRRQRDLLAVLGDLLDDPALGALAPREGGPPLGGGDCRGAGGDCADRLPRGGRPSRRRSRHRARAGQRGRLCGGDRRPPAVPRRSTRPGWSPSSTSPARGSSASGFWPLPAPYRSPRREPGPS